MKFLGLALAWIFSLSAQASCTMEVYHPDGELVDVVSLSHQLTDYEYRYLGYHFTVRYRPDQEQWMSLIISWFNRRMISEATIEAGETKAFLGVGPLVFHVTCQRDPWPILYYH